MSSGRRRGSGGGSGGGGGGARGGGRRRTSDDATPTTLADKVFSYIQRHPDLVQTVTPADLWSVYDPRNTPRYASPATRELVLNAQQYGDYESARFGVRLVSHERKHADHASRADLQIPQQVLLLTRTLQIGAFPDLVRWSQLPRHVRFWIEKAWDNPDANTPRCKRFAAVNDAYVYFFGDDQRARVEKRAARRALVATRNHERARQPRDTHNGKGIQFCHPIDRGPYQPWEGDYTPMRRADSALRAKKKELRELVRRGGVAADDITRAADEIDREIIERRIAKLRSRLTKLDIRITEAQARGPAPTRLIDKMRRVQDEINQLHLQRDTILTGGIPAIGAGGYAGGLGGLGGLDDAGIGLPLDLQDPSVLERYIPPHDQAIANEFWVSSKTRPKSNKARRRPGRAAPL